MEDKPFPAVPATHEPPPPSTLISPNPPHQVPRPSPKLVELAGAVECFHSPDGETYATVPVQEHWETWRLRSRGFRHPHDLGTPKWRSKERTIAWPSLAR